MQPHVVIIGGGFGGLSAARALACSPVRITLIDRSNHHLFQPLLYQVATAGLSPANIAAPIRAILRYQDNVEVLMAEVTGILKHERKIQMRDRQKKDLSLSYDYLIVATGSWYSYFGHNEWAEFAPGLKSIVDATKIRKRILLAFESAEMETDLQKRKSLLTFVLIGAGPTGVEMAGSIAELAHQALKFDFTHIDPRDTKIILIEAGPRILANFNAKLADRAAKKLRELGVEMIHNARVSHVDAEGVVVGDQRIASNTMIWCAGVVASPAGKWFEAVVDRSGRVKVDEWLNLPGFDEVFVIGDTANCIQNNSKDGEPLPGVAPVAMQEGRYVASLIMKKVQGEKSLIPFQYQEKGSLATVGRSFAIVELKKFRLVGWVAWVAWLLVHIYYLIGFRNRMLVLIEWAWAYFTFQRGARLITMESQE